MPRAEAAGVFLDRDGTLIREVGYLSRLEQLEVLPRAADAIRLLNEAGFRLAVITNQSAVARGLLTEPQLNSLHDELRRRLAGQGAIIGGIYYCPHHPTEGSGVYGVVCDCRKPNTGLVRKAEADLGIDAKRSYLVGDQALDMELAARVGAKGIWIRPDTALGRNEGANFHVAADLWESAQWIVGDYNRKG